MVYSVAMSQIRTPLPPDFKDHPRLERWVINALVLLRLRAVKAECCESFRKEGKMIACKGCPTLYDKNSESWVYRMIARLAKRRSSTPALKQQETR